MTRIARTIPAALWVLLLAGSAPAIPAEDWLTDFERSGGRRTPRYQATGEYCRRLAGASDRLHYTEFGVSPRGRGLPLVIADRRGRFTPEEVRRSDNLVVLVQACIHAGESCGKDAGLMLLRDMTVAGKLSGLLDRVTLLFIPIFNVDGHERFGPYNRVNQNGPEEMGWRVNARNLNLNRDFLKADTPEMQAWHRLFQAWRPDFFVDIHSTDGADYQYAITYSLEIHGSMDPGVTAWTREFSGRVEEAMAAAGYPLAPYIVFRDWHDPRSGLRSWVAQPRLSQGYTALHDVPGLLIETHMLKDYPTRVAAAYELVRQTLAILNQEHGDLRRIVQEADLRAAGGELLREPLPLAFEAVEGSTIVDFLGVDYEIVRSDLTGGEWVRYGTRPVTYRIPYFDRQRPTVTVRLPEAYLIPPEWSEVIERLELQGVAVDRLAAPETLAVRSCRFRDAKWQEQPYEGRHPVTFTVEPLTEERAWPAGTAVVSLRQPAAKVAAHVLEPEGPDSYVTWGFFDPVMDRVEYVESYVIEEFAREMLADDPALRQEFEQKKAADEAFAGDPWAIRDWFYRRTPYFDDRFGVYPVGMVDDRSVVESLPLLQLGR